MRNLTLLTAAIAMAGSAAFGQAAKRTSANNYMQYGELDNAKAAIDEASVHEKTAPEAKTWFYRGQIYQAIYETQDSKYKSLSNNALEEAYQAFSKCNSLDDKNFHGDMTYKYMDVQGRQFVNEGIINYNEKRYDAALKAFETTIAITNLPQIKRVDSLAIYYAGACAEQVKDYAKAEKYYRQAIAVDFKAEQSYVRIAKMFSDAGEHNMASVIENERRKLFSSEQIKIASPQVSFRLLSNKLNGETSSTINPCPGEPEYVIFGHNSYLHNKNTGNIFGRGTNASSLCAGQAGFILTCDPMPPARLEAITVAHSFQCERFCFPFMMAQHGHKWFLAFRKLAYLQQGEFMKTSPFLTWDTQEKPPKDQHLIGKPQIDSESGMVTDSTGQYETGWKAYRKAFKCPASLAPCKEYIHDLVPEGDLYMYSHNGLNFEYKGQEPAKRDVIRNGISRNDYLTNWPKAEDYKLAKCNRVQRLGSNNGKNFLSIGTGTVGKKDFDKRALLDIESLIIPQAKPENLVVSLSGARVDEFQGFTWSVRSVHFLDKSFGGNLLILIELKSNFETHDARFNHPIPWGSKQVLAVIISKDLNYVSHKRVLIGDELIIRPGGGFATVFKEKLRLIGYDKNANVEYDNILSKNDPMGGSQTEVATNMLITDNGELVITGETFVQKNYGKPDPIIWVLNLISGTISNSWLPNCGEKGACHFKFNGLGFIDGKIIVSMQHFDEDFYHENGSPQFGEIANLLGK